MKKKLIRVTTVPISMRSLLHGQLKFMSNHYNVVAVSSDGDCFEQMLIEQGGIEGVKIEMTRKITPFKDIKALYRLICLFRSEKPFIVHTHTPKAGLLGMLAARITGVPNRLHTIAGLPLLEATGAKRLLLNFIERLTNCCATRVYPNSFVMREIMIKNKLANPRKLNVIANGSSNGIDTSFFSTKALSINREEIRESFGIEPHDFVFVFVGRIVRDKGMNELIRAFILLSEKHSHIKLLLVGSLESDLDPIDSDVLSMISDCKKIISVGHQQDVRPYFAAADALAFPSYREGFPNVVMQAGAMGLPSIVTDINGCNEIIISGINGVIIPPKNQSALYKAMLSFVQEPVMVESLAAKAREMIVSRYEQQLVWNAILKEYKRLEQ